MKRVALTFVFLTAILFTGIPVFAQVSFPDYSGWTLTGAAPNTMVLNGQDVTVLTEQHENFDEPSSTYSSLYLIYISENQTWLGFYTRVVFGIKDGEKVIIGANFYFFENSTGEWSFVRDFSESKDLRRETADFLRSRYNLQFRQQ